VSLQPFLLPIHVTHIKTSLITRVQIGARLIVWGEEKDFFPPSKDETTGIALAGVLTCVFVLIWSLLESGSWETNNHYGQVSTHNI
jgi:hypothetical protein